MKINFSLKDMELSDHEIISILRKRIIVSRSENPKLETFKDGTKAFVYYYDDWSREHCPPERHVITCQPEDIKVLEALEVLETYLKNHRNPI